MSAWELPTSLEIGGVGYPIRTDFRAVLDVLQYLSDPEYEDDEKKLIFLIILFPSYQDIPAEHYEEAFEKASEFIDMGMPRDDKRRPHTMEWKQDAAIIIPAVNRVMGREIRSMEYLHWWTFLGAYMEIGESLFSSVLSIRQKRSKGKKLEKHEMEFYRENKNLIDINRNAQKRSQEEKDALLELLGLKKQSQS